MKSVKTKIFIPIVCVTLLSFGFMIMQYMNMDTIYDNVDSLIVFTIAQQVYQMN